jgi:hypothetical protein
MSDNYEFMKSSEVQDATDYSPYTDKQYNNYINDINNGVYTNNSLTLVNFDLGQIYNSQKFTESIELFAVLPIAMVAGFSNGSSVLAPLPGSQALCTIKSNFLNLIHQADITVNGKSIESTQPFINMARHFQLISEMSVNDLATLGHSIGFSPTLDNPKSARNQPAFGTTAGASGNGYSNNRIFAANTDNQTALGAQNTAVGNAANQYKIGRYVDITNTSGSGVYGGSGLITGAQLNNEFRPYYTVQNNYMVWHDYAVIKLNYLFESLNKMGLVKRIDAQLRLWVNTGTVNINVANPDATTCAYNLTPANNTFSNTCPILVNYQAGNGTADTGIVKTGTLHIVAGLYIARPPTTSFSGINLALSAVQHPLTNCRLYYSQVTVDPQKSIDYVQRNRNKKVIYRSFVTNSYNNIAVGASFNALVNSGIVHPTAVLICPFIGAVPSTGFGDSQWKSPFDTCPATMSPLSLTNLQVGIGGQNILNSTLSMTYENFLQQVNLAEQLTSSDFGVATGLISQGYWEASKWYFVNVERGNIADKLQPRNINVSFSNNSNVPIDVIIFTFYSDQLTIDVETGIVTK